MKQVYADQIVTTESQAKFLAPSRPYEDGSKNVMEIFLDVDQLRCRRKEFSLNNETLFGTNVVTGEYEYGRFFLYKDMLDRGTYFGYVYEKPSKGTPCQMVTFNKDTIRLNTVVLTEVKELEEVDKDTYSFTSGSKKFVVKHLKVKNIVLGIPEAGAIPTEGKRLEISRLELFGNKPLEVYKKTSKFNRVIEKPDVYICDTERTRYILLKNRKKDVFGLTSMEPVLNAKLNCNLVEFIGSKPILVQKTIRVDSSTRLGHLYKVKEDDSTYYLEARFRQC